MRKRLVVPVLLLTVLMLGCAKEARNAAAAPKPAEAAYKCVAGPDEQCASDLWYADYQKLKKLQEPYTMPQETQDLVNGMATRLRSQIPAGYTWDEAKQRFTRLPPSPLTPPKGGGKP